MITLTDQQQSDIRNILIGASVALVNQPFPKDIEEPMRKALQDYIVKKDVEIHELIDLLK